MCRPARWEGDVITPERLALDEGNLHLLWTWAVDKPGYERKAWQELQHHIEKLLTALREAHARLEDGQFCQEGLWYCHDAEEVVRERDALQRRVETLEKTGVVAEWADKWFREMANEGTLNATQDLRKALAQALAAYRERA